MKRNKYTLADEIASFLYVLTNGGGTVNQLMAETSWCRKKVMSYLWALREEKLAYPVRKCWRDTFWCWGSEEGIPVRRLRSYSGRNAERYARWLRMLTDDACSVRELAGEVGCNLRVTRIFLYAMRKRGLVYTAGWAEDRRGYRSVPMLRFGSHRDAPRRNKDRRVSKRDYWQRQKQLQLIHLMAGAIRSSE